MASAIQQKAATHGDKSPDVNIITSAIQERIQEISSINRQVRFGHFPLAHPSCAAGLH
jgi:hypothetical protein